MKKITELTDEQGKEILEFVYPKEAHYYKGLSFEATYNEEGKRRVTFFGLRPIIGINYHNGQDNCILHFDNTKVVLWLYQRGFDISEYLEVNKHHSEIETDLENFAFAIYMLSKSPERFKGEAPKEWNLEFVLKDMTRIINQYYYDKEYE